MHKDLVPISIAYVVAIAAAIVSLVIIDMPMIMDTLIADIIATSIIFLFSRFHRNSSVYDAYWSVIPPLIAVHWTVFHIADDVQPARQAMVLILVWLWGIRLTANWATHWQGFGHEDWRYAPIRQKAGQWALIADFAAIHLFPTVIVFLACMPLYAALAIGNEALGWIDALAFVVTAGAILIELIADLQLHRFVKNKKPGDIINEGLWRYSRHPNYFGEMSFWFGLMLFGLAAHPEGFWWIMPGALSIAAMFFFASIPLMDQRSLERRPEYRRHMQQVSAIIPWFRQP